MTDAEFERIVKRWPHALTPHQRGVLAAELLMVETLPLDAWEAFALQCDPATWEELSARLHEEEH